MTYSYQANQFVQCVVMAKDESGLLTLNEEYKNDLLVKVYDKSGKVYNCDKRDLFIIFDESEKVLKGTYFNILLERNNLSYREESSLSRNGKFWKVEGLEVEKHNIDGVFYSVPCDIEEVGSVIDYVGEEFEVEEIRQNQIILKNKSKIVIDEHTGEEQEIEITPIEPVVARNISYLQPFIFGVLNQNMNKADFNTMVESQGDAIVIFPYYCDVAEGDVLTVLAGTITQKDVMAKTGSDYEPLPAFFVAEVTRIVGSDGTEYVNGFDFILCGTNTIKWITDNLEIGEAYSVTYKVYPTYTVTKNIPTLRSSENQRFPKKAVVKLKSSYAEQTKANRQSR